MKRTKRGSRCSREVNEARLGPDVHPVQGKLSLAKVILQPLDRLLFHVPRTCPRTCVKLGRPREPCFGVPLIKNKLLVQGVGNEPFWESLRGSLRGWVFSGSFPYS